MRDEENPSLSPRVQNQREMDNNTDSNSDDGSSDELTGQRGDVNLRNSQYLKFVLWAIFIGVVSLNTVAIFQTKSMVRHSADDESLTSDLSAKEAYDVSIDDESVNDDDIESVSFTDEEQTVIDNITDDLLVECKEDEYVNDDHECTMCPPFGRRLAGDNPEFGPTKCEICSGNGKVNTQDMKCICLVGFTGNECQFNHDEMCNGYGRISMDGEFCVCTQGFKGQFCSISPCKNFSELKDDGTCSCSQGASGKHCQCSSGGYTDDDCSGTPCHGRGTIDKTATWEGDDVVCKCNQGYTGRFCQFSEAESCSGNGEFTLDGPKLGYTGECICKEGWEGKKCEMPLCEDNGIYQKGSLSDDECFSRADKGECASENSSKFMKEKCKKACSLCDNRDEACQNSPRCICKDGYTGNFCEFSPCNGRGTYIPARDGKAATCKCDDGWKGDACDIGSCNGHSQLLYTDGSKGCECLIAGHVGPSCAACNGHGKYETNVDEETNEEETDYDDINDDDINDDDTNDETYTCTCDDHWFGKNCEEHVCNNRGTFNTETNLCTCTEEGYTGFRCELPCNGEGELVDNICSCYVPYQGMFCQTLCHEDAYIPDGKDSCECLPGFTGDGVKTCVAEENGDVESTDGESEHVAEENDDVESTNEEGEDGTNFNSDGAKHDGN